jgi:glycosyltransferase involved in cell wall biosynthesis
MMQNAGNLARKTVVFVNFSKTWGGGERWHLVSAQELLRRGYSVEILAHSYGELAQIADQAGIPCQTYVIGSLSWIHPVRMFQLVSYWQTIQPEAVIVNGSKELKTAGMSAKYAGVEQIVYRRGLPKTVRPTWLNRSFFSHIVTDIIVNSQDTLAAVQEIVTCTGLKPPCLIHNGLDATLQQRAQPQSQQVAVVGRLSHEKGVDLIIQALPHIIREIPDAHVRIIGGGPERRSLEQMAIELRVRDHIQFVGYTQQVFDELSRCALLALPSRWEGSANVLLEAMLMHMPCVAFDLPSTREVVIDGVTGYLVPPENVQQLADRIVHLLQRPERIITMGDAGYERLRTHFSLQKSIDQLEELLFSDKHF